MVGEHRRPDLADEFRDSLRSIDSLNTEVFHAGTSIKDGAVVTNGGRVLTVVGSGGDFKGAIARAYAGVNRIRFEGAQYRTDIGKNAHRSGALAPLAQGLAASPLAGRR